MKKIIAILIVIFMLSSCGEPTKEQNIQTTEQELIPVENAKPMGDRLLGITISDNKYGFQDAFLHSQQANVEIVELNIPWNAIEPKNREYTDPWGGVFLQTTFYGDNDVKVFLSIALINTVAWELPSDLAFEDEEFSQRFNDMISFVLETMPENVEVAGISIGNEVDYVLGDDQWDAYGEFVKIGLQHIKSINPDIRVGVKTTVMGGLFGYRKDYIVELNKYTDVVMLNYYPQNEKFEVLDPDVVFEHFDAIADIFPKREVWMSEVGYQSGDKYCASSEQMQAEFFHNMFTAWDEHSEQITTIQVDWLHDQSKQVINDFKKYYGDGKGLVEYLSTLGLRNYDDTDKLAWLQVLEEVEARR